MALTSAIEELYERGQLHPRHGLRNMSPSHDVTWGCEAHNLPRPDFTGVLCQMSNPEAAISRLTALMEVGQPKAEYFGYLLEVLLLSSMGGAPINRKLLGLVMRPDIDYLKFRFTPYGSTYSSASMQFGGIMASLIRIFNFSIKQRCSAASLCSSFTVLESFSSHGVGLLGRFPIVFSISDTDMGSSGPLAWVRPDARYSIYFEMNYHWQMNRLIQLTDDTDLSNSLQRIAQSFGVTPYSPIDKPTSCPATHMKHHERDFSQHGAYQRI